MSPQLSNKNYQEYWFHTYCFKALFKSFDCTTHVIWRVTYCEQKQLLYARHCTVWSTSIISNFCNNPTCRYFISNNCQRKRNQRQCANCLPHLTHTHTNSTISEMITYLLQQNFQIPNRYSRTHASHSNSLSYSQIHSYSLPPPSPFLSPLRKKKTERKKITGSDTWYGYLTSKLKTKGIRTLMKTYH